MTENGHPGFSPFDTAVGCCCVAWSERGIDGVQLPEGDPSRTRSRLARRFPARRETPPPGFARDAITRIATALCGDITDLSGIALDMTGLPGFDWRVYAAARTIGYGATITYGELASRIGDRALARAVGQALGRNPFPILVPCHRVLAAGGRAGGFSADGGVVSKLRLLSIERAQTSDQPALFADLPLISRTGAPAPSQAGALSAGETGAPGCTRPRPR